MTTLDQTLAESAKAAREAAFSKYGDGRFDIIARASAIPLLTWLMDHHLEKAKQCRDNFDAYLLPQFRIETDVHRDSANFIAEQIAQLQKEMSHET